MITSNPHLKALYRRLYFGLPWPAPLPVPKEVRVCWNRRFRRTRGACLRNEKIIEINVIYQDPRLSEELEYLVIHEAAHFIWNGHPRAFTEFLQSAGVPERYVVSASESSEIYRLVQRERAQGGQLPLFR